MSNDGSTSASTATTVLLLGGCEMSREVAFSLQRLGVVVHVADSQAGTPAHRTADFSHVIDLDDNRAVLELVQEIDPAYVVPMMDLTCLDAIQAIEDDDMAMVIPNAKAVALGARRDGFRDMANNDLGLPNSTHAHANSAEDLEAVADVLGFPCVVKPILSGMSGGHGQTVCEGPLDLPEAWDRALAAMEGRGEEVLVEQYIPFDFEITVLTIRSVDPATGNAATWFCEPICHRQEHGELQESWQPAELSEDAWDNARSVAARITKEIGGRGLFAVELFIKGTDVYFSGVAARPHDSAMVTIHSQRYSEFDLHARAVMGLPLDTTLVSPGACCTVRRLDDSETRISHDRICEALAIPEADLHIFGPVDCEPRTPLGVALATADDVSEARIRARSVADAVAPKSRR